jgi:hypothetical protein
MNEALEKIKAGLSLSLSLSLSQTRTHIHFQLNLHDGQNELTLFCLLVFNIELMLLGFISLLITVSQIPISRICIPTKAGSIMLPCNNKKYSKGEDG